MSNENKIAVATRVEKSLFGVELEKATLAEIRKVAEDIEPSRQGVNTGHRRHPFDMRKVADFKTINTHHSSCLESKRDATTGLGFVNDATTDALDELNPEGCLPILNTAADNYWGSGNGYLEVVRRGGIIKGLYEIPPHQVKVYVESDLTKDFHYRVLGEKTEKIMARFGETQRLLGEGGNVISTGGATLPENADEISEIIHFKRPSTLSRWYGVPDWLSAVPCVELVRAALQHNYDFFNNRGVPEFILVASGGQIDAEDWKHIEDMIKSHVGQGNSRKTMAINIPNASVNIDVIKLAMETVDEGSFQKMMDSLAAMIVSAHRVPPLLAGIMVPGKLGASNELPNALATFQALTIGQAQRYFQNMLACTLGKEMSIERDGFEFNQILDHINLDAMNDAASTRTPVGPADPDDNAVDQAQAGRETRLTSLAASIGQIEKMSPEDRGVVLGTAASNIFNRIFSGTSQA